MNIIGCVCRFLWILLSWTIFWVISKVNCFKSVNYVFICKLNLNNININLHNEIKAFNFILSFIFISFLLVIMPIDGIYSLLFSKKVKVQNGNTLVGYAQILNIFFWHA